MILLVAAFLSWFVWASCSESGLAELRDLNPEFQFENKHKQYLVAMLNEPLTLSTWPGSLHVEQCSLYMPNWSKAEQCVRSRLYCQSLAPRNQELLGLPDAFAEDFVNCWKEGRPWLGPMGWLRLTRVLYRSVVGIAVYLVTGGEASPIGGWLLEWMERAG